jgi:hypothetical protein
MVRTTIVCAFASGVTLFVLYQRGWLDKPPTYREQVTQREEDRKIHASETDVKCLGLGIWHGTNKGKGSATVQRLIGQVMLNVRDKKEVNLCVVLEKCLDMMPQERVGQCYRNPDVVNGESYLGTTRIKSAEEAETLARKLLMRDPSVALRPEQQKFACVQKYVRNFAGLFWTFAGISDPLGTIRKEVTVEMGPPVGEIDGNQFFGQCPQPSETR